eukprot:288670-Rhodomonas_salina.2
MTRAACWVHETVFQVFLAWSGSCLFESCGRPLSSADDRDRMWSCGALLAASTVKQAFESMWIVQHGMLCGVCTCGMDELRQRACPVSLEPPFQVTMSKRLAAGHVASKPAPRNVTLVPPLAGPTVGWMVPAAGKRRKVR